MKIEETPNDVLAVKSLDNQLRPSSNLHPDLLQPPFSLLLVGSAGSGKSRMVSDTAVQAFGMRLSNSDPAFEQGLKKAGLKLNSKDIMSAQPIARIAVMET